VLTLEGFVDLPAHAAGGFDHGDVDRATGRVFVAHTANGTIEVFDGAAACHLATILDCPDASGVLCDQAAGLVFAAARADGRILAIDARTLAVRTTLAVGSHPNGLAWDGVRRRLLVADIGDEQARVVGLDSEQVVATIGLPGRPRWCVHDPVSGTYVVNIRDPAAVAVINAETGVLTDRWPVASTGPHGLDLDVPGRRLFVACDGGSVVVLDASDGRELGQVPIPGVPDAIWFNPARERLYVAIGEPGTLTVIDTAAGTIAEEIATEAGAKTTAFDPVRQRLYVFQPQSGRAAIYQER
jgi:DNA-binding beta-propeller fold protein YncE